MIEIFLAWMLSNAAMGGVSMNVLPMFAPNAGQNIPAQIGPGSSSGFCRSCKPSYRGPKGPRPPFHHYWKARPAPSMTAFGPPAPPGLIPVIDKG